MSIPTSEHDDEPESCDVCGRTLLIGERAEPFLAGGERRAVCDLCVSRALYQGWVRESAASADPEQAGSSAGRSLVARLHAQRALRSSPPSADPGEQDPSAPAGTPGRDWSPKPRHVHAVPLGDEQKIALAVELFNRCEHRRTISGVSRSLGLPDVSVRPATPGASLVRLVVAWELCWYRYEVDLSDDHPTVRLGDQGYELHELSGTERIPNASARESGTLALASPPAESPQLDTRSIGDGAAAQ